MKCSKTIPFLVLITHLLFGTYQFNLENPRHKFVNNVDKSKVFKLKVQHIFNLHILDVFIEIITFPGMRKTLKFCHIGCNVNLEESTAI